MGHLPHREGLICGDTLAVTVPETCPFRPDDHIPLILVRGRPMSEDIHLSFRVINDFYITLPY